MNPPPPPFPFLVGSGRSGTTLLRAMLDAHPEMTVPGESYFIEQMLQRRDGFRGPGGFDRSGFEAELFADQRFRAWNVDPALVRVELDAAEDLDLAEAVRATYRAVARKMGTARYGDKTPSYALCMEGIAALLPEAVFVHLVRDPRDVVASYRRASWGPRTLETAADAWRTRVTAAREAGARLGPARFVEIRYEDLVAAPEVELGRLCEVIALPYTDAMLDYRDGPVVRRSVGMEQGAHTALQAAPTVGLRNWRDDLRSDEAARIGLVVDGLARRYGYDPSPPPSPRERWRVRLAAPRRWLAAASLRFRRTRLANRLRGPWRRLRRRATLDQLGIPAEGVS